MAFSRSIYLPFLATYLIFVAVLTFGILFYFDVVFQDAWTLFDWLINYQGGFSRRGLLGEVFLAVSRTTGVPLSVVVFGFEAAVYAVILGLIWGIVARIANPGAVLLVVCAPYFIAFPLVDMAGAGRKEILIFLLVAYVGHGFAARISEAALFRRLVIALLVLPLVLLTHEAMAAFAVYLLGFAAFFRITRRRLLVLGGVLLLSVAAIAAILLVPPAPNRVADICASVAPYLAEGESVAHCSDGSAIAALQEDSGAAFAEVRREAPWMAQFVGPAILLALAAFVPLGPALREAIGRHRTAFGIVAGACLLSALLTLPVLAVALDWGRFLYMHLMCVGLIVLSLCAGGVIDTTGGGDTAGPPAWIVAAYALLWGLRRTGPLVGHGMLWEWVRFGKHLVE